MVELLVAATISGFVLAGVLGTTVELTRTGLRVTNYAEMDSQVRRALAQLEVDLKSASSFTWNDASDITVTVPRSDGTTSQYTYAWSNLTYSFFRVPGANSAIHTGRLELINGVPLLADASPGVAFVRLDRNGNAATSDAATKVVRVALTVSRNVGIAAKTTRTTTASFTLRNKRSSR